MSIFSPVYAFPDGLNRILRAVELGDSYALWKLGHMHLIGDRVALDPIEAAKLFHKAATLGRSLAQRSLGYLYRDGVGVERDEERAFYFFNAAARQGDPDAQYEVGRALLLGIGTKRCTEEAQSALQLAAYNGSNKGLLLFAWVKHTSVPLPPSPGEAFRVMERRAQQGDGQAEFLLGIFRLADLYGVPRSEAEARKHFQQGADLGSSDSARELGRILLCEEKDGEALQYFLMAAEQGDAWSQTLVASAYGHGLGAPVDHTAAKRWYRVARKARLPVAESSYGNYLLRYAVQGSEIKKAVRSLESAAKQGIHHAKGALFSAYQQHIGDIGDTNRMRELALKCVDTVGVPAMMALQDIYGAESEKNQDAKDMQLFWLQMAAEEQDTLAMRRLSWHLSTGDLKTRDLASAVALQNCAIHLGDVQAANEMAYSFLSRRGLICNMSFAASVHEYGARHGDGISAKNLAAQLAHGDGVKKNPLLADFWSVKAQETLAAKKALCGEPSYDFSDSPKLKRRGQLIDFAEKIQSIRHRRKS